MHLAKVPCRRTSSTISRATGPGIPPPTRVSNRFKEEWGRASVLQQCRPGLRLLIQKGVVNTSQICIEEASLEVGKTPPCAPWCGYGRNWNTGGPMQCFLEVTARSILYMLFASHASGTTSAADIFPLAQYLLCKKKEESTELVSS